MISNKLNLKPGDLVTIVDEDPSGYSLFEEPSFLKPHSSVVNLGDECMVLQSIDEYNILWDMNVIWLNISVLNKPYPIVGWLAVK